jgi:hypothetical protein
MNQPSLATVLLAAAVSITARPALAQAPLPSEAASQYSPAELERIVSPIALYPDPLLAQVLAAATYPSDIPDAARWADAHRSITGDRLAAVVTADDLAWDPSVQALLPFPSVLDMMARDTAWTEELGNAVLVDRPDVMDAVQHMRHAAWEYGYLRSNTAVTVTGGPWIEILPVDGLDVPVPSYDPLVVFGPPGPGIFVGNAIGFGFRVGLGPAFAPWGWGTTRLVWPRHVVIINRTPWRRTWDNRAVYVHPYAMQRTPGQRVTRSPRDRSAASTRPAAPPAHRGHPAQHGPAVHRPAQQPGTPAREHSRVAPQRRDAPVARSGEHGASGQNRAREPRS